jgi:hypothetical protein
MKVVRVPNKVPSSLSLQPTALRLHKLIQCITFNGVESTLNRVICMAVTTLIKFKWLRVHSERCVVFVYGHFAVVKTEINQNWK